MSRQQFPTWVDQPGSCFSVFKVTGASVSTGAQSSAGLDGRGANFCTIARVNNTYTVQFLVGYPDSPYIVFTPITANAAIDNPAVTGQGMTFDILERDDETAAVNIADFYVLVLHFNTVNFVS